MKKLAIIMLALIAINSLAISNGVEASATVKTKKIVQSVKQHKKRINRSEVRRKLISYARRKGMMFEKKLTVRNSSWLPPTAVKYYDNTTELTKAGKASIDDLLDYFDDYEPIDFEFNVIVTKKHLYIVYG